MATKKTQHSKQTPQASPSSVGIVIKQGVPEANALAIEVADFLKKKRKKLFFAMESKDVCERALGNTCNTKEELIDQCDLIVVLGGDGTFISVARLMYKRSIPLLGVNMGQLGFLTEIKKSEVFDALEKALDQKLPISQRTMLQCTLTREGERLLEIPIVNDVVISKGAIARIFDMTVYVNGVLATNIKSDGLILSTPTGSTAYCLAAGGPIVEPDLPAVEIVPICPHSLTLRPLILKDSSKISVVPQYRAGTVILTLDGQASVELKSGDVIEVTKFEKHALQILRWPQRDYFALLREKLKYGYRD